MNSAFNMGVGEYLSKSAGCGSKIVSVFDQENGIFTMADTHPVAVGWGGVENIQPA